jgi:phosphoribosylglycinamide formyltransferase-1
MSSFALVSPALPSPWPRFRAPLRLGVMASGKGSNLEAIAAAIQRGDLQAEIRVVIYNNPGAVVAQRAKQLGLPAVLLNHREFSSREALDQAIIDTLLGHDVEWVIMAGWMRRVTAVLIQAFPNRLLNIHPSLLPSFPGIRAVEQALAQGVQVSGCTVHYAELEVDSGPIIMQAAVPVLADDTPDSLQARIQAQEHLIYPAAIALAAAAREKLERGG